MPPTVSPARVPFKGIKALLKDPDFQTVVNDNPVAARQIFDEVGAQDPAWQKLPAFWQDRLRRVYTTGPPSPSQQYADMREGVLNAVPTTAAKKIASMVIPESMGGAFLGLIGGPATRGASTAARWLLPPAAALGVELLGGGAHPVKAALEGAGVAGGGALERALGRKLAKRAIPELTPSLLKAMTKREEQGFLRAMLEDTGLAFTSLTDLHRAIESRALQHRLGPLLSNLEALASRDAATAGTTVQVPAWILAKGDKGVEAQINKALRKKGQYIGDNLVPVRLPQLFKLRQLWRTAGRETARKAEAAGPTATSLGAGDAARWLDDTILDTMDSLPSQLATPFADALRRYGRTKRWDDLLYQTGFLQRTPQGESSFNAQGWKALLQAVQKNPRKYGLSTLEGFQKWLGGGVPMSAPQLLAGESGSGVTRFFHRLPVIGAGLSHVIHGKPSVPRLALPEGMVPAAGAAARATGRAAPFLPQAGRAAVTGAFGAEPPPSASLAPDEQQQAVEALRGLR